MSQLGISTRLGLTRLI